MNESVEYVIRVVLKARDDLSLTLARIRKEIHDLSTDADVLDNSMSKLNSKITSLNQRAKATAETLGRLKKATDDLGGSVEKFNKLEEGLAKAERTSEDATHRQRDAMGRKVVVVDQLGDSTEGLTKTEKANAIAQQLSRISTEKSTEATKKKTAASIASERAARKEVDKLLIAAYHEEAAANTKRADSLRELEGAAKLAKRELRDLKQLQGIGPRVTSAQVPEDFDKGMLEALRKAEKKAEDAIQSREQMRQEVQKASQAQVAERVRTAGGVPVAEDKSVRETAKQLGIARRQERQAKRAIAEAQAAASKLDLSTAAPAELASLRTQQEELERSLQAAQIRVSNAFAASKKAQEDATKAQREALVQHVLAMNASDEVVEAEKKETAAVKETTKALTTKSQAAKKPTPVLKPQAERDAARALREEKALADAAEEAANKQRFIAREVGEGKRRFQVYDTEIDKVVKRLGSMARAEEEAGDANAERQRKLELVAKSETDIEGARRRFEERERQQQQALAKRAGVEVTAEVDTDKTEKAVEETIKKTVGKTTKTRKKVEIDVEPEVNADFDIDELVAEAVGFEHIEEKEFDVTPHIMLEHEPGAGHFAEQESFTRGIGAAGGSQESDESLRKRERDLKAESDLREKQKTKLAQLNAAYEDQRAVLSKFFQEVVKGVRPVHEFVIWLEEAEKRTRRMAREATGLGSLDPEASGRLLKQAGSLGETRELMVQRAERKPVDVSITDDTAKKAREDADDYVTVWEKGLQERTVADRRRSFAEREREAKRAREDRDGYVKWWKDALDKREVAAREAVEKRTQAEEKAEQKSRDDYVDFWENAENARELLNRKLAKNREERDQRALKALADYNRITGVIRDEDLINLDDRDLTVLNKLKRELDEVANSYDNLSQEQIDFASLSRLTNRVIQDHTQALRENRKAITDASTAQERAAARDRLAASARARFGDASGIRVMGQRRAEDVRPEDRVALQELAQDLRKVATEHERGSASQRHYASMAVVVEDSIKRVNTTLNEHEREVRRQQSQLGGLAGVFDRMSKAVNRSGDSVASLDNRMQGMIILAVMGFAQQFISVLVSLVGTLGAVASSAIFAAGAIGGALVAGIAQALPMVGLLAATMSRVKTIMDVVKQADLVDQQKFQRANDSQKKLADTTDAVANAQDSLRSASDGLGDSQRRVSDAQQNLTKARADAARQLRDLIAAEKDAELAARGAALNQEDAQQRILDAVASGQGDLDRLGLDFEQASLDRTRADATLTDTRRDLGQRRRGGVEGSEGVVAAKRQVEDARRSVVDAERAVGRARRGIDQARKSADAAAADSFSGAEKLQFLLQQLTPAEREFYRAALALRQQYREVFRPVTDILIRELTKGTNDLTDLLKQPKIGQAARGLATSIAKQMSRVRRELFDPKFVDQLLRIVQQSRKNLEPVADILINLGHSFANIAEDAGPALTRILGWLDGLSGRIRNLTEDKEGMASFFDKAADNAIAWADAIEAVIILIGTIAGVGADTGLSTVEGFTEKVKEWTAWINDHRPEVQQFFEDSVKVAKQLFRIVAAIAKVIVDVNDPQSVKPLVDIIVNTLIPALSDAIKVMGNITKGILWFLNLPGVGKAVEVLIMVALVNKVLRTTTALLGVGMKNWRDMAKTVQGVFGVLNRMTFGGLNKALGVIATSVGNLIKKIPLLGKLGDKLKTIGDRLLGRTPAPGGATRAPGTGVPVGGPAGTAARTGGTVARDVETAGGAAAAAKGGGLLSKIRNIVPRGGLLRGAAGVGAKLGLAGLAVDFGINLIDSGGNPLKATQNTASDLTFGLIPRAKDTEGRESKHPKIKFQVDSETQLDIGGTDTEKKLGDLKDDIKKHQGNIDFRVTPVKPTAAQIKKAFTLDHADKRAIQKDYDNYGTIVGKTLTSAIDKAHTHFTPNLLLGQFRDNLSSLPKEARQKALDAQVAFARRLEKEGRIPKGAAASLAKQLSDMFDLVPTGMSKAARKGVKAMERAFKSKDLIDAAEETRQRLNKSWDDFPVKTKTTGRNAAQNFVDEIEFLRQKVKHSTGKTKKEAEEDLHGVQRAAKKWGKNAKDDMVDQLHDMGIKSGKKARRVRDLTVKAFVQMTDGVGKSASAASLALFDQLNDMGLNAGKILKGMGLKPPTIELNTRAYKKSGINEMTAYLGHAQTGKFIPGQGDGDKHPVLVESGEYVLNKKAVRGLGRKALDFINFNMFPRFQKGGEANWGSLPPLHGAISKAVAAVQSRFPSMAVTSTLRHSTTRSGNPSNHNIGIAADVSSTPEIMHSAAQWIKSSGMAKSLLEGIHNPNLSVKSGATVPASFWGGATWADHINHIHMALRSLTGNLGDAALKLLGQVSIKAPKGFLRDIALGQARRVRRAWNRYLTKRFEEQGGGDDQSYPTSKDALSPAQFKSVARTALGILGIRSQIGLWVKTLLRQATHESTLNPNARNDTAAGKAAGGPKGILQVVDGTFNTYKEPGHGNVFNALDNTLASIKYVIAQYGKGDPNRAAEVLWARGGGAYAKGGEIPGRTGQAVPILAHAKEWVVNPIQQHFIARIAGTTVGKLKSALGFSGSHERGFQGGGDVGAFKQTSATNLFSSAAERRRIENLRLGIFRLPTIPLRSWEDVVREANRAMLALNSIGNSWKQRIRDINREIAGIRSHLSEADKEKIADLKKGGVTAKESRQIAKIRADITDEEKKKIDALQDERKALRQPGRGRRRARGQVGARRRLDTLNQLTREGGVLDLLDEQREEEAQQAADQRLIGLPAGTVRRDRGVVRRTRAEIRKITLQIAKLRRGGVTKKERARIQALQEDRKNEQGDLKDERSQLAEDTKIQAQRMFRIIRGARGRVTRIIRRAPRGGRTLEQDQTRFERQQAQLNVRRIEREQTVVGDALGDAEKRLRRLQRGGVSKREAPEVAKLTQQINALRQRGAKLRQEQAEGIQSLFEAQVAAQEADVNAINQRAERRTGRIDRGRRIATALGRNTAAFDKAQIGVMNQQADELQGQIARAKQMGNTELAQSLQDQVADLRTSIVELSAQMLRDAIEQVEQQAQRRLGRIDIQGRFADVRARAGDRAGAARQQIELQRQRTSTFVDERARLVALQQRAAAEGNTGAVQDLQDKIEDLDATVAESVQTTQELIAASHQLSVDILKSRTETTTGLLGTGQKIIETVSTLLGIGDPAKILPFLEGVKNTLIAAATELVKNIQDVINDPNNPFGQFASQAEPLLNAAVIAFQQGPEAFANWLAANAPAIGMLVEQMGGPSSPMGQLFLSLIGGMSDNTQELLDNTIAIRDLTGKSDLQDFSSSAWQMFRQAIFTGAGKFLPQYATSVPSAQAGARIMSSGLLQVHSGEDVVPARVARWNGSGSGDINTEVNITNPTEVADPVYLGQAIGWRIANNPNLRP